MFNKRSPQKSTGNIPVNITINFISEFEEIWQYKNTGNKVKFVGAFIDCDKPSGLSQEVQELIMPASALIITSKTSDDSDMQVIDISSSPNVYVFPVDINARIAYETYSIFKEMHGSRVGTERVKEILLSKSLTPASILINDKTMPNSIRRKNALQSLAKKVIAICERRQPDVGNRGFLS